MYICNNSYLENKDPRALEYKLNKWTAQKIKHNSTRCCQNEASLPYMCGQGIYLVLTKEAQFIWKKHSFNTMIKSDEYKAN